jgi:hypothetical protein
MPCLSSVFTRCCSSAACGGGAWRIATLAQHEKRNFYEANYRESLVDAVAMPAAGCDNACVWEGSPARKRADQDAPLTPTRAPIARGSPDGVAGLEREFFLRAWLVDLSLVCLGIAVLC